MNKQTWTIRNMDKQTIKQIKEYAYLSGKTTAQTITDLITKQSTEAKTPIFINEVMTVARKDIVEIVFINYMDYQENFILPKTVYDDLVKQGGEQ
jgi:hypothetical protein